MRRAAVVIPLADTVHDARMVARPAGEQAKA
jgi:hypothetical protein